MSESCPYLDTIISSAWLLSSASAVENSAVAIGVLGAVVGDVVAVDEAVEFVVVCSLGQRVGRHFL